jgi:predicted nucleic acid-binding protein
MITVDTSALSMFFRRSKNQSAVVTKTVADLINQEKLVLFGIVRQELLSGIKHQAQFEKLEQLTQSLPLIIASHEDHVLAARYYNLCRAKGIQGSVTDFLICAMATRLNVLILTTDPDFVHYEKIIPIKLFVGYAQ